MQSFHHKLLFVVLSLLLALGCSIYKSNNPRTPANTNSKPKKIRTGLRNDNVYDFGLKGSHKLVFTFDDGPGDGTSKILALLKKYKIEAMFFVIGENAKENPEFLKQEREKRAGGLQNIIGNHSYTHPMLDTGEYLTNPKAVYDELFLTNEVIKTTLGSKDFYNQSKGVLFFRAPAGEWVTQDVANLSSMEEEIGPASSDLRRYYGPIYWDIGGQVDCKNPKEDAKTPQERCGNQVYTDAADWECWENNISIEKCSEGYLNKILSEDGGVILSHDIYAQSAEMWEKLLPILIEKKFKFYRLDKIPAIRQVKR
jgi:peptidoglycan/xylan/chitin deacetylase (PgdA/CDA1 family)